jgi:uncharacterized membrane protein
MFYTITALVIGFLGLMAMNKTKSKTSRQMIMVPCMIIMVILVAAGMNIIRIH